MPREHQPTPERVREGMRRADHVARLLDDSFRIPGTRFRFGLDAILGLVPGVGDFASLVLGVYPLVEALNLGAPRRLLNRMIANLLTDFVIGLVPVVGDLFDLAFRSTSRNVALLRRHLEGAAA